jgi:hypothetical protein
MELGAELHEKSMVPVRCVVKRRATPVLVPFDIHRAYALPGELKCDYGKAKTQNRKAHPVAAWRLRTL